MPNKYIKILVYLLAAFIISCNNGTTEQAEQSKSTPSENKSSQWRQTEEEDKDESDDKTKEKSDEEDDNDGCKYADGIHSATVEYYNP